MTVLSEQVIKERFAAGTLKENSVLKLAATELLTPAAKEFLTAHHIRIEETPAKPPKEEKAEHMTHLYTGCLVPKTHPRIALRGKIDSLEAELILMQLLAEREKMPRLAVDLEEIIGFIRTVLQCEVKGEPLPEWNLLGLTPPELRAHSHHPSQYYGMRHFLPSKMYGRVVAGLNKLRTLTREAEIAALHAFPSERTDIILAFNRLSSLFFILMFKVRRGDYEGETEWKKS